MSTRVSYTRTALSLDILWTVKKTVKNASSSRLQKFEISIASTQVVMDSLQLPPLRQEVWLYHSITEIASSQNILDWNLCMLIYVKISNFSYLGAKNAYLREISLLLLVEFVLLTSRWKYDHHMPSDLLIQILPSNRNVINMQYEIS